MQLPNHKQQQRCYDTYVDRGISKLSMRVIRWAQFKIDDDDDNEQAYSQQCDDKHSEERHHKIVRVTSIEHLTCQQCDH